MLVASITASGQSYSGPDNGLHALNVKSINNGSTTVAVDRAFYLINCQRRSEIANWS
jgi:hypothetical protein